MDTPGIPGTPGAPETPEPPESAGTSQAPKPAQTPESSQTPEPPGASAPPGPSDARRGWTPGPAAADPVGASGRPDRRDPLDPPVDPPTAPGSVDTPRPEDPARGQPQEPRTPERQPAGGPPVASGPAGGDRPYPAGGLRLTPFRGLRYVPERVGSLAAVTSPPYDVVVRPDGQRRLETADPYNVVRLILPDAATAEEQHRKAARTLDRWLRDGVLAPDPRPAVYVYEQRDGDHLQRGVIGALRLSPPEDGVVLPHEDVMPGPVADRAELMRATGANLEPLLLAYRDGDATAAVIERVAAGRTAGGRTTAPLLTTTTDDGVRHRLWALTDPADLAAVTADLSTRQALIADGHHRWATYRRLQAAHPPGTPWDFGLVLLVDTARYPLRVRAIHRVLPRLPAAEALTAAAGAFRVRRLDGGYDGALTALAEAAADGNAFVLAGDGFHLLDRPDPARLDTCVPHDRPEPWRRLDATVLHSLLLDHVWQVPDSPDHIRYIHDTREAVGLTERLGGTAVLMHPVREHVVLDLARQGVMMPRKSTSFGPKPASGLVIRRVDLM